MRAVININPRLIAFVCVGLADEASLEFNVDLTTGKRRKFFAEGVDDLLGAAVRLTTLRPLSTAPSHCFTVLTPVCTTPTPHGRCLSIGIDLFPVDAQRKLPAD